MNMLRRSDPSPRPIEELNIVLVEEDVLELAAEWVTGCEYCAEDALLPFDYLLDVITNCNPSVTEYLLRRPVLCPFCSSWITEKTRIRVN